MPIKPSQAVLAALALIAAPAFAQDSTAPAAPETPAAETPAAETPANPAPETAPAPAADAPETEAAPAAPAANAEPQVGQEYVKDTFQAWTMRCLKTDQPKDPCDLFQRLTDGEGNPVAEMIVIPLRNSEAAAGATLIAPLETDLAKGVGIAVGSGETRGYPFNVCAQVGCISRMGITQPELDAMKRGNEATVILMPYGGDPEQPVRLTLSLAGFTAAFDTLSAYVEEPAPAGEAPAEAPAADAPAN